MVGLLIVGVFDENSFRRSIECYYEIQDLNTEIAKYRKQYYNDMQRLKELNTNPDAIAKIARQLNELKRHPKAIERIARECYFMKADDEDIFVLSDDEQPFKGKNAYETTE